MTVKEVKKLFQSLERLDSEAQATCERTHELRSKMIYKPVEIASRKARGGDYTAKAIAELDIEEKRAGEKLYNYITLYRRLQDLIEQLENPAEREVMNRRYILYQGYGEIAEKMHYTERTIYIIHGQALKNISLNFSKKL